MFHCRIPNSVIFNVLRILKAANPGDLYYNNYIGHWRQHGDKFCDTYHIMWQIATEFRPKTIMEIGVRTGLSICQLLSAYIEEQYEEISRIVLCDLFNDGFCSPGLVRYNMRALNIPQSVVERIEFLQGDSKIKVREFIGNNPDQRFDYILVDGSHDKSDAREDLDIVHPIVSDGGFVVFDDLSPTGMLLKDVWDAWKADHRDEYEWFEDYNGKGVGVGRRIGTSTVADLTEDVS